MHVADGRVLPIGEVRQLVTTSPTGRTLMSMDEPAVNVLRLTLALDRLSGY
jgi:K+-transporting ATPase c subunit